MGKSFTKQIKHNNLNLGIHIKRLVCKILCYSRSVELHEKVIGAYMERDHYNSLEVSLNST
ncbi:TPA: hypothetical protein N3A33_000229 [Salmonella enterica subsp. salamae serovar 28:r:e,n,z15]|nr:hypothetical protein [Salmonella enterica subsp. salamae serovar 28:r:e,n,z15]